ncbi:MAG TPA: PfkB family carbohydrate kinase, partial [Kiritimatiellia bacterium]
YVMHNKNMTPEVETALHGKLTALLKEYDVVIVADFGHGLITDRLRQLLCDKAKFLAVNTQTNAGNRGFNMISKYTRADYVSIGEPEVRLDCRDLVGDLEAMAVGVAKRMSCKRFMVTRGSSGCFCVDKDDGLVKVPAFSIRVVDRIGAGDAVLALTSPLVAQNISTEATGFIANVVGAEACMIMGNKSSIEPASLFRHITSLLK